MRGVNQRLLTDQQIAEVCELIIDGEPIKAAAEKCHTMFGIKIAKSTLHGYPEVRKAIRKRESVRRIETKEALDKSLPAFVDILLSRIDRNEAASKRLDEQIKLLEDAEESKPRLLAGLYSQRRALDATLKDLIAQFRQFYNDSTIKDNDFNDASNQTIEERMRRLENLLTAPLQDFEGEPFEDAIGDPEELN